MRYTSFPPIFPSDFPVFFHTFPRCLFSETPARSPSGASTFHPKRKYVFPQTPKHFYTNTPAFFVQTYISMPQRAENHAKTLLSNKINITFATLLQKTRVYLPGLVHGSGNGEARPERMDCAPPTNETGNSKT